MEQLIIVSIIIVAGWKRCLRSGGIGVGLAAAYVMITSRDRVKEMIHQLKSWTDIDFIF